MSIITITFDTEKDEQQDINAAINAEKLALCIHDIVAYLRQVRKYQNYEIEPEKMDDDILELIDSRIGSLDDYTY